MRTSEASAQICSPIEVAFAFLADLGNDWQLASPWIEVVSLTAASGPADAAIVQLDGPLRLSRTVKTRVDHLAEPHTIHGHGTSGSTRAEVTWSLDDHGDGTRVRVSVALTATTLSDRLIWRAGGRAWLAGRLRQTLEGLDAVLADAPRPG